MAQEPNQVRPASADMTTPPPPPPHYPEGTSPEQIRQDIRRTRRDMDETVDALEERLRPRHLIDDVLDLFRSSGGDAASSATETVRQTGSRVIEKLKQNPMPAALIGAGVAWLMFEDRGPTRRTYEPRKWDVPEHSGSYVDARTGQPYGTEYGGQATGRQHSQPSMAEQARDTLSGVAEGVRGTMQSATQGMRNAAQKVGEWTGGASDSASGAAGAVRDYASEATDTARDYASGAADRVREYAGSAREQLGRGYDRSRHYVERGIEEYPLAMGAAAAALGVLAGLVLPRTRTEDQLMGERADEIKHRAREVGTELVDRGRHVASATASAAASEAEKAGLNPDRLADKVKSVASDVKHTAVQSARREGLDPDSLAGKGKDIGERAAKKAQQETQRQRDELKRKGQRKE
jgi:hypothetical protein